MAAAAAAAAVAVLAEVAAAAVAVLAEVAAAWEEPLPMLLLEEEEGHPEHPERQVDWRRRRRLAAAAGTHRLGLQQRHREQNGGWIAT